MERFARYYLLAAVLLCGGCAYDVSLTPSEQSVLNQIAIGRIGELKGKPDSEREIRGIVLSAFLTDALTGPLHPRDRIIISYAIIVGKVPLYEKRVPYEVILKDCEFRDDIDASDTRFSRDLYVSNCKFKSLDLTGSSFDEGFTVIDSSFSGLCSLSTSHVKGNLFLLRDRFLKEECFALDNATVEGRCICKDNEFMGSVRFRNSVFQEHVMMGSCKFSGNERNAFECIRVRGAWNLAGCSFSNDVNFQEVFVGNNFLLNDVRFGKACNLSYARVDGTLNLSRARFEGPASFVGAKIEGNIDLSNSQFSQEGANLGSVCVRGWAYLVETVSNGPMNLFKANVSDLHISRSRFESTSQPVSFELADINTAFIVDSKFAGPVSFNSARISKEFSFTGSQCCSEAYPADFTGMEVRGEASFERSSIMGRYAIDGMRYKGLTVGNGNEDSCLNFLRNADFSTDAYSTLEGCLRSRGDIARANDIYIEGQRRLRHQGPFALTSLWSMFVDFALAYGKHPIRILYWTLLCLGIGSLVFSRRRMTPSAGIEACKFNRFWYSLDVFLPIIDLHLEKHWIPKEEARSTWLWLRLQILLGWILVSLALAVWTGMIK